MKSVLLYPDERLRQVSKTVEDFDSEEFKNTCDELLETLEHYNAQGLAAIQIGTPLRVFVTRINAEAKFFVNPVLEDLEGELSFREGCLSFPGVEENIKRAEEVTVRAQDRTGEEFTLCLDALEGVAVQHEYDHLDGKLFIDRVSNIKKRFMKKSMKNFLKKSRR